MIKNGKGDILIEVPDRFPVTMREIGNGKKDKKIARNVKTNVMMSQLTDKKY